MYRSFKIWGLSFGALGIMAISMANAAEVAVTQDNGMNRSLGNGYDTKKEMMKAQCVEGKSSVEVPNEGSVSQGDLKLHVEMDENSTADKLGVSAGGKARIGVLSFRASAEYFTESMSTGLSLSYVYTGEYMYNAYLVNSSSSPVTTRPDMGPYIQDAMAWNLNCGDEYTYAVDKGARLFLSMRMDFVSKQEKSRFAAQFGVEGPLFNANGSFEKAQSNYSKNTQLTVNALQIGGDPARLGSIFCPAQGENGAPNPNCLGNAKKAISCSFGDMGPCMEVMAQMVSYGNGQDDLSFAGQIKNFKNYNTLKLYTQPWGYLGSRFPIPPTQQDIQNYETNQSILSDLFEENYKNWATAYRYWRGKAPRLNPEEGRQKDQMGMLQARFKANMSSIAEGIRACYEMPMSCESKLKTVKERSHYGTADYPSSKSIEELLTPETYAQYCDLIQSDSNLKKTLDVMNQIAFLKSGMSSAEEWNRGDTCFRAQEILTAQDELDLSGQQLTDLRPVSTLSRLRKLDLSRNKIANLKTLAGLTAVEELKLDDNPIYDVTPLSMLTSLRILSIQNIGASNITSLIGLRLSVLDLRRNRPVLNCPMQDHSVCRTVDFSELAHFFQLSRIGGYFDGRVGQAAAATADGRVFISGGVDANGDTVNWVEEFSPKSLTFSVAHPMRNARVQHTVTSLDPSGNALLIAGGGEFSDTFEVYDTVASAPGDGFGKLKVPRSAHTATLLTDGRVLLVGGWTMGTLPKDHRLDATNTAELYDPRTGQTMLTPGSMQVPRALHAAALLKDGRVLISGGYLENSGIDTLEVFDPLTGRFEVLNTNMHVGRASHSTNLLPDGTLLIAGGYSKNNLAVAEAELFDPATQTTRQLPPLEKARGAHAGVTLSNGKVLLAGGSSAYLGGISNKFEQNGTSMMDAELYDPLTRTFSPLNPMIKPRSYPVVAPLPNSRLLIVGGMGGTSSAQSAEFFEFSRM